ncbi:tyrosine-type recombinase/integrase [Haloarculaceae archaeon H-GB2-1]|nr:tyrosine-type recombinase/integrase [Haloarculaceae archaeon H-GB1-1]MEA5386936.1 tyrosine-type recombinase/integrase [Haloarculaceae archaeon H-GB11]MEA5408442.1 tyrosine-type recombinase/integrase [Haloarculaceae archaeon H-GB2-1]
MSSDLISIPPAEAVNLYLHHRESELSKKSLTNQRYRLNSFLDWCEETGLDDMNELTGRNLHQFRVWRSQGKGRGYDEISKMTLRGILATLRTFLEFCDSIEAVEPGMRERVLLPEIEPEEISRDDIVESELAKAILEHLDTFEYASRDHVIMVVLWHTGMRLGTLRSLDVDDFDANQQSIRIRHQPETGTPLKNKYAAERYIAVGDYYTQVIQDYIDTNRFSVTDDYGRLPLISSREGRLTATPIRRTVYRWTRPCMTGECPHEKEPVECEFMQSLKASSCPSSVSPHAVRRGSITSHLREGTPEEIVSGRMDVTGDILDLHYDKRTEFEKMQIRREFLEDE